MELTFHVDIRIDVLLAEMAGETARVQPAVYIDFLLK
jgi:hypothetical protein